MVQTGCSHFITFCLFLLSNALKGTLPMCKLIYGIGVYKARIHNECLHCSYTRNEQPYTVNEEGFSPAGLEFVFGTKCAGCVECGGF